MGAPQARKETDFGAPQAPHRPKETDFEAPQALTPQTDITQRNLCFERHFESSNTTMIYAARRAAKILGYFGRQILGARVGESRKETKIWARKKKL